MTEHPAGPRYEASDASPGTVVAVALGLAGLVAAVMVALWLLPFGGGNDRAPTREETAEAAPRLMPWTEVRSLLDQRRTLSDRRLSSAEWLDQDRKVARIPIVEAMRLVAEQGGSGQ